MSKDTECPYCGADVNINHNHGDGYEEDELHQQECSNCEKTFVFHTSISYSYDTYKADCLNGAPHEYEKTNTFPPEAARLRCKHCADEEPIQKSL